MGTAIEGTWWGERRNLSPSTEILRGVVGTGSRWVFVGDDAGSPVILTAQSSQVNDISPTFTSRTPAGSDLLNDVAWLSSPVERIWAVGLNGRYEYSANDGDTWQTLGAWFTEDLYGITAVNDDANSRLVVVGDGRITAQNSSGIWTSRWTGSQTWRSVAHRVGVGWVVVGNSGYATVSATALAGSWATPYQIDAFTKQDIAANSSYYITVGNGAKAYRSATGVSGSWTELTTGATSQLKTIAPMAADNEWVAFATNGRSYRTTDNGDTWTENAAIVANDVYSIDNGSARSLICGSNGSAYVSFDDVQEDPTPVNPPTVGPAFTANPNMVTQAVRRIIGQLRSGR